MKILVVDDGQLAINSLIRILCRVAPDCDYISAMTTDDALTWMRQGPMDAARIFAAADINKARSQRV